MTGGRQPLETLDQIGKKRVCTSKRSTDPGAAQVQDLHPPPREGKEDRASALEQRRKWAVQAGADGSQQFRFGDLDDPI